MIRMYKYRGGGGSGTYPACFKFIHTYSLDHLAKMFAFWTEALEKQTLLPTSMRKKTSKQKNQELLIDSDQLWNSRKKTSIKSWLLAQKISVY